MSQRVQIQDGAEPPVNGPQTGVTVGRGRKWLVLLLGLICSGAVAFGLPLGLVNVVPDGPLGMWRCYGQVAGNTAAELSFVLTGFGFAGWLWAWTLLRRYSQNWILLGMVVWVLPHLLAPPGPGDLYNYVEQGWVVLQGQNPATVPAGSVAGPFSDWVGSWAGTTVGYPPLALYVQAAMVWLANESPWLSLLLMRLPALSGLTLMVVGSVMLARRFGIKRPEMIWCLAVNPFIILHAVAAGHNDALATGLVVVGVALALTNGRRGALVPAGLAVILLGGMVKPTALVLGAIWPLAMVFGVSLKGRVEQIKALVLAGVTTGALVVVCVVLGALTPLGSAWLQPSGDPSWASNSLYSIWVTLSDKAQGAVPFLAQLNAVLLPNARVVCLAVILLAMLALAWFGKLTRIAWIPFAVLTLSVLIGPAGRAWYLLPAFVALALTGLSAGSLARVTITFSLWQMPRFWTGFSYLSAHLWSWLAAALSVVVLRSWRDSVVADRDVAMADRAIPQPIEDSRSSTKHVHTSITPSRYV